MKKDGSIADTVEFVRQALCRGAIPPETPEERRARLSGRETDTHRFIREALGEPELVIPSDVMNQALIVLLEAEQERRRLLKQQAN